MRTWIDPEPIDIPKEFIDAVGGHPLVSKTLYKRNIKDIKTALGFISPERYKPASPVEMPGMNKAIDILVNAIQEKQKIGVWGDFDVDGQTATATFVSTLKELKADVIYHIPNRVKESHGINVNKLRDLISEGVQVLLSCDTGISDHTSIDYAIQSRIRVIITDHHDIPNELPNAHAIVNPKLLPDFHPLRTLPGVGVAYKVAEGLYQYYDYPNDLTPNIDLAALGIVADLALQVKDTRYLLQRGLDEIRRNPRAGLRAMLELSAIDPENVTEEHIGYMLSPRLNALGRLSDARLGVELLTTNQDEFAQEIARKLEQLNEERKLITQQVFQAAVAQIEADPNLLSEPAIVLSHPAWPSGVIGIVANRIVEHYHRPAILISTPSNKLARGSARSIEGINITNAIAAQKDLLETFGGHPMAGGFSIRNELIAKFKQGIFDTIEEESKGMPTDDTLHIDEYLRLSDLTLELVSDFERLAPHGPGNPPLTFATRALNIQGYTSMGHNDEHSIITVEDKDGTIKQVIWWQSAGLPLPDREFDLAYNARSSTFQGQKNIQLEWLEFRHTGETPIDLGASPHQITVIDCRGLEKPEKRFIEILSEGSAEIWNEGDLPNGIHGRNRFELKPANNLVIWTIPPGRSEFLNAIKTVKPSRVYLFGVNPGMDNGKAFLTRLAGLLKYTLVKRQGVINIDSLAAACAQRVATIKAGLIWLHKEGFFSIELSDEDKIVIKEGSGKGESEQSDTAQRLKRLLEESSAYRAYYLRADKDALLDQT